MTTDDRIFRGLPSASLQQAVAMMAAIWAIASPDQLEALAAREALSTEMIAEGAEAIGKSKQWGAETAERDMLATLSEEVRRAREWAHL